MIKSPQISVVMPVYNGERFLAESINSVLDQTYKSIELIIINDASTDSTLEILNNFLKSDNRITLINNENNIGVAESRNIGINNSKGDYIAFIDADDIWAKDKLEKQYKRINDYDLICTSYSYIDEQGKDIRGQNIVNGTIDFANLLKNNVIGCSTVLIKKDLLKKFYFNKEFKHEDYVLWLNLIKNDIQVYGINEVLVKYRVHKSSINYNKIEAVKGRWEAYRKGINLPFLKSLHALVSYMYTSTKKYL